MSGFVESIEAFCNLRASFGPVVRAAHHPLASRGFGLVVQVDHKLLSPGMAKQIGTAMLAGRRDLTRAIIVDDDIDIYDQEMIEYAITFRVNPMRDIDILHANITSPAHPMATEQGVFEKMIIDATKKPDFRGTDISLDPEGVSKIERKWSKYGLG